MENQDIVPTESSNDSETTPLVVEEKEAVETSEKANPLATLASELSELSLELGSKVTSTSSVDTKIEDSLETAIQVPSSNSEEDQSGDSTDVEQSETEITDSQETALITDSQETALMTDSFVTAVQVPSSNSEGERSGASDAEQSGTVGTSRPPTQGDRETASPRRSNTDPEIREGNRRLFDNTMWWLLIDMFMISFPIYGAYDAMKNASDCVDGEKLPILLMLTSFTAFLVLVGRIARNITKKFSRLDENKVVPRHIIDVGDVLTTILNIAKLGYFYTIRMNRCSHELYSYACFYGVGSLCILGMIYFKMYLNR